MRKPLARFDVTFRNASLVAAGIGADDIVLTVRASNAANAMGVGWEALATRLASPDYDPRDYRVVRIEEI